ncbi:hypothetical protein OIO90_001283 [Microbotryomycetes sp. JL221]|nr:hypothetical protein OIO90_001283 [Microbotryomycetes sp. JL221]
MNHIYHTLSPLMLITACILLLLTFLSPVMILSDRVSLVSFNILESASTSTTKETPKRAIVFDVGHLSAVEHRMIKRTKLALRAMPVVKSSLAAASRTSPVSIRIGFLGLCSKSSGGEFCQRPSLTPMFDDVYDSLRISTPVKSILPQQLPMQPTAALVSSVLAIISLFGLSISALAMHLPKKAAFLGKFQPKMRKLALICGGVSTLVGVIVTGVLMVQLKKSVDDFNALKQGQASIESGFHQMWAALALETLTVLFLAAESKTKG